LEDQTAGRAGCAKSVARGYEYIARLCGFFVSRVAGCDPNITTAYTSC
jgi:hypothetical protein